MTKLELMFIVFNVLWLVFSFAMHDLVQEMGPTGLPDYQCERPEPDEESWPEVEELDLPEDRCECSRDG
jgi:hypothetical protein